jgi:FMN phosphatase YigB (HAD superfamily)
MRTTTALPIVFLDFDRTVFDTSRFIEWLGDDRYARMLSLAVGELAPPDFRTYIYDEVWEALSKMRKTHHLVLLTYAKMTRLQRLKIRDSGILPYLDDVVMTTGGKHGGTGKGEAISTYIRMRRYAPQTHWFVDDDEDNLRDVASMHPDIQLVHMCRADVIRSSSLPVHTVTNMFELCQVMKI